MSNDTDRTLEDDLIYQYLAELIKLIECTGRKVKGIHIEFERSDSAFTAQPTRTFRSDGLTTEQVTAISKVLTEPELETLSRAEPVFELRPVDDEAAEMDAFLTLSQDDKILH